MVSDCKFIPYLNILQNFVQNVRKPKWLFILSCSIVLEDWTGLDRHIYVNEPAPGFRAAHGSEKIVIQHEHF